MADADPFLPFANVATSNDAQSASADRAAVRLVSETSSPYAGVAPAGWLSVTRRLIDAYPLAPTYLAKVVLGAWEDIHATRLGTAALRVGRDWIPTPQITGTLLHALITHWIASAEPTVWRPESDASDKDLVCLPQPDFSTEIKTSSNPSGLFGNRSVAQAGGRPKKVKSGYYLGINFDRITARDRGRIRLVRLGWLDQADWIGQCAPTGQQARLAPTVLAGKFLTIYEASGQQLDLLAG